MADIRHIVTLALAAGGLAPARARADEPRYETVIAGTRVEASRDDASVATEVITREELEASGADTVDEALAARPGLRVTRGLAGAVLSLQGLDPEHTLILVDGQRVIGRVGGGLDLSRLPLDDVERIEIVKGPASALHGSDAIGGVVNVVTRRTRQTLEAEATSEAGSFGTLDGHARLGGTLGPLRLSVSAGLSRADAWDLDPDDVATTASGFETRHASAELRLTPRPSWRGALGVRWLLRDQDGVEASASGAVFDRRNRTETLDVYTTPEWKPSRPTRLRASLHVGFFRDQYVSDQRGSDALDQRQDTREVIAEGGLMLDWLVGGHFVTVGLDALAEALESPRLDGGRGERTRVAAFAQDEWVVARAPRLALVPVVRVDRDSRFGTHLTPRLAVRADPWPALVLRGSVGLGYRAPDFKELYLRFENPGAGYVVVGDPMLAPEVSRSATLGAEWQAARSLTLSASAFRHDLDDLIVTTLASPGGAGEPERFVYTNVGAATAQGLELGARAAPAAHLVVEAGYTFTAAQDDATGAPLPGRPRHRATLGARWRHAGSGVEVGGRACLSSRQPFEVDDDADGTREPRFAEAHAVVDARVAWQVLEHLQLFAGADNLLDAGEARFNPMRPRAFYAGATATY